MCPLNLKEMNGAYPFLYIYTCGCVFSQSSFRTMTKPTTKGASNGDDSSTVDNEQLDVCPQCATKFSRSADVFTINPSKEEEERMRVMMNARRAREPTKAKSKKRKAATDVPPGNNGVVSKKPKDSCNTHSPSPAPTINPAVAATSRALASSLAAEEVKRKAAMSDAVRSLYHSQFDKPRKETFTTMGTFTRVSVTVHLRSRFANGPLQYA